MASNSKLVAKNASSFVVFTASLKENKPMLIRNLRGLERVAKKEFEEDPLPIFDINEEIEESQ